MTKIKMILTFAILMLSFAISAQNPGYQPYQTVASIYNGQRTEGSNSVYIKFDGNLILIDKLGNGMIVNRYIDSGEYSDGNKIYYLQSYNHGTMYQGSGWITNRNKWLLVSPDRQNINEVDKQYDTTIIYKVQSAASAGSMIY